MRLYVAMFSYVFRISGYVSKSDHLQLVTKPYNFPHGSFINNILPLYSTIHTIPSPNRPVQSLCFETWNSWFRFLYRPWIQRKSAEKFASSSRALGKAVVLISELILTAYHLSHHCAWKAPSQSQFHCSGCSSQTQASTVSAKRNL